MIKIVQRQDIEDVLTGNIDAVKSVVYYTHLMAPEDGIHPLIKREGDVLKCKLFSNQISELISGNLICQVEIVEHDDEYPDREYNETKKINLNIWIKGKNPQDETLRVGYENLTIGLKQAVDKANTSVQPDDLTHYVNVEDFETQISEKVARADVYVKDEIDTQINTLRGEIPSTAGFATEQWVESKGYLTEHQQLKTINGESITGNGDIKVSGATETWVEEQISTKVDRADVYVKSEIDNQINTIRGEIPSIDGFATETWVESKGYLTEHQQLKTINGETITGSGDIKVGGVGVKLANGAEVFNRYNIEGIGGNGYIGDLDHGIFSHAEGYVTQSQGNASHAEGVGTQAKGIASHAEGQNGDAIGKASHVEGFDTIANSDYSHAEGICNKGYSNTIHEVGIGVYNDGTSRKNAHTITTEGLHYIPGVGGYTGVEKLEDVEDLATVLSSKLSLNDVYSKDEIDNQINTLRGEIPQITGLATETWVEEKISTKVDRSYVYSKDEVNTQINTLRGEIPSLDGIATETWVENKGYLTQHQSLAGLATQEYVDNQIGNLDTILDRILA